MEKKYIVSTTTKYSDGTETTVEYASNADASEIEHRVAVDTAKSSRVEMPVEAPEIVEEVSAEEVSEPAVEEIVPESAE